MQMLYNSDHYVVVEFDVPSAGARGESGIEPSLPRGGYEIVDKFARKEIFIEGALAESFREGVNALARGESSVEAIDEYLGRFAALMHQPLVLH